MADEINQKRDSAIIYRSFYEAIKDLPEKNQAEMWTAIFEYSLNFKELELKGLSATVFKLIKPQLDANNKRYVNGTKPKKKQNGSKTEANEEQHESKGEANKNKNENENENENKNVNDKYAAEVLENDYDIENILVSTKIKPDAELLKKFLAHLGISKKIHPDYKEFLRHFTSWIGVMVKNGELQPIKPPKEKTRADFY